MSDQNNVCPDKSCRMPQDRMLFIGEQESRLYSLDKTPDGVLRRWRPSIIRAARAQPAKQASRQAVYELGLIGLSSHLARLADSQEDALRCKDPLIRAIAETRVLSERLAVLLCTTAQDAEAYRFYLEQAAKAADPAMQKSR